MAAKKKPKNQHERTRVDHATEKAEDYVEAIAEVIEEQGVCRVKDLAEHFAVSHVTVNRTVSRLQRDGYVTTEPYSPVELTNKGTKLAKDSRHRHEIVFSFLVALGVSEETAATDTEGIEHHVSPETLALMEKYIAGTQD
jgi:DtxR family manganese transport transcriptional regulator